MSERIRLSSPRLRVVVGNPADESTWQEMRVQSINRDQLEAEKELLDGKRGAFTDHPILVLTAIAYAALRRTGKLTAGSLKDFEAGCIDLEAIDELVDPTRPEPDPG